MTTGTIALLVAIITFLTAAIGAWQAQQAKKKTAAGNAASQAAIIEVHTLVNDRLTTWIDRALQLTDTLTAAGLPVPARAAAMEGEPHDVQDPGPASTPGPAPGPEQPPAPGSAPGPGPAAGP